LTFCFACHGDTGKGDGPAAPLLPVKPTDHTRHQYMAGKTDRDLFKAISGGGEAFHGSRYMPSWNKRFLDEEIWDLMAYLRYLHRPPIKGSTKRGKSLYTRYCVVCHREKGRGDGPMAEVLGELGPPPLDFASKELMATRSDSDLFFAILGGGESGGKADYMPRWGGRSQRKSPTLTVNSGPILAQAREMRRLGSERLIFHSGTLCHFFLAMKRVPMYY
jgi:cytochrome c oxidase cbb3-type subunit 3